MTGETRLFANLGAEEPDAWRRMSAQPRVRTIARLWASLFPAGTRFVGPGAPDAPRLASALARDAALPAYPFCAPGPALVPWLSTEDAAKLAGDEGVPYAATPPGVVRRVHDKAFALAAAAESELVPDLLVGATLVLAPEDLRDADAFRDRVEAEVSRWPAELRARFVLKPRIGTSARGRLEGVDGRLEPSQPGFALERLRAAGGAIVEPWLERTLDLSAQLYVAGPDDVRVLGTLRQLLNRHGGPLGHLGRIDDAGEVDSGTAWDAGLRASARILGRAAAREGFRGPCGLDAFVFRSSDRAEILRSVVELNARFTVGTVALGQVRRAFRVGLARGARAFYFGFEPGPDAWSKCPSQGTELFPLLADDPSARLCLATDERALAETLPLTRRSA